MSYNIDTWEQIECSLTIRLVDVEDEFEIEYGKPEEAGTKVEIETGAENGYINGMLRQGIITVEEIHHTSEGSGRALDNLKDLLGDSTGIYQALLVWEGGESITLLTVNDGEVEDNSLDIPALIRSTKQLQTERDRYRTALEVVQAHHSELNQMAGRDARASYTLHIIREALAPEEAAKPSGGAA